jgi:hypothetical protein
MRSRKTATVLLACIVAQVCLLVMLVTMPVYALEGGYCTNCIGGCFTYGCDFSGVGSVLVTVSVCVVSMTNVSGIVFTNVSRGRIDRTGKV